MGVPKAVPKREKSPISPFFSTMGTQVLRPHGGKASLIFRWTLPSLAISSFAALDPPRSQVPLSTCDNSGTPSSSLTVRPFPSAPSTRWPYPHLMRTLLALATFATLATAAPQPFEVKVTGNPKGSPIVLIPGLSSAGAVYASTVARYCADAQAKYQCHTLTLAGFAGVPALSDGPFLAQVRDALVTYIETNKLKKPHLIGHSLGGHMALWIAALHPKLTGKLIIVDSLPHLGAMMFPDPTKLVKQAEGMRLMITNQSPEQYAAYVKNSPMLKSLVTPEAELARVTDWGLHSSPVAVGNAMYDLYTTDLRDKIAAITSPTLVLCSWIGYKDYTTQAATLAIFETQYDKLKEKKLVMHPTAKHFLMLDDPAWYLNQVDLFLK